MATNDANSTSDSISTVYWQVVLVAQLEGCIGKSSVNLGILTDKLEGVCWKVKCECKHININIRLVHK